MDTAAVEKVSRGVTPLLLVLAALAFLLLPVIGVSCNGARTQPILNTALSSLPGGANPARLQHAQLCLQELSSRDSASYSGTVLAFGGAPHVDNSNLPDCSAAGQSTAINVSQSGLGVQPLFLAGFILLVVTVLATVLRAPLRNIIAAATAVVAFVLLLAGASSIHTVIDNQIDASSGGNTLSSLGIGGTLSSYADVHVGVGYWLSTSLLLAAALLNAAVALIPLAGWSTASPEVARRPPPPPPPPPPRVP